MIPRISAYIAFSLLCSSAFTETLGFFEQKINSINFEKGKWSRTAQPPCYTYTANEDGASVEVMRIGTSNLVPFKATKGLKISACGSTVAFDEGFIARESAGSLKVPAKLMLLPRAFVTVRLPGASLPDR